jgi:lysozyme
MTLWGPDTSNNNFSYPSQAQQLVESLPGQGYSWIEHKVSQGSDFQDAFWPTIKSTAANMHFPCIGYHYVDLSNPASQAQNFVNNQGGVNAMLDQEDESGDIGNLWAVINAFNNLGVNIPLVYLPEWYWGQIGSPDLSAFASNGIALISSGYPISGEDYASTLYTEGNGDNGEGWNSYGGATPSIWQFTDDANLDNGFVGDVNAFKGNGCQLRSVLTTGSY